MASLRVQHTLLGNGRLPHSYINMMWVYEAKISQIDEGVSTTVFIQKISELGSDLSQEVAMSPWRLSIFVSQGNISKSADPTAGAGSHMADTK